MNCDRVQEELLLLFGSPLIPNELQEHIEQCEQCRRFHEELSGLSRNMPDDDLFYPTRQEAEKIQKRVESGIASRSIFSSPRVLAVAASVFLVLGVSYISFRGGDSGGPGDNKTEDTIRAQSGDMETELDAESIEILFENVASDPYRGGYELLLQELTDEELDYLEQNLNAGELL